MPVTVRPLREQDLPAADRIFRLAFGTFLGLPDPLAFAGDTDYVRTRWLAHADGALAIDVDGELVGSNFATHWGSVGLFGPLSVQPGLWDRGLATRLLEPTMELFNRWQTTHVGLFTFAHSPKHLRLYQKFDFWPRFLTLILSVAVDSTVRATDWSTYAEQPSSERERQLSACRELTETLYPGLDLEREIRAVHTQGLGDTVLLRDDSGLAGLAVCHCGPGSEAGSGACYVKFGAVRPGARAERNFERLLDACTVVAARRGLVRFVAGVNTARHAAYRALIARGLRPEFQGVVMQRANAPAYNRPEVYAIDDWR